MKPIHWYIPTTAWRPSSRGGPTTALRSLSRWLLAIPLVILLAVGPMLRVGSGQQGSGDRVSPEFAQAAPVAGSASEETSLAAQPSAPQAAAIQESPTQEGAIQNALLEDALFEDETTAEAATEDGDDRDSGSENIEDFFDFDAVTNDRQLSESATGRVDEDKPRPTEPGEPIEVQHDFRTAVQRSQLEQRPLLVIFGAQWCSWCRKLEQDLSSEEARSIRERWIVVEVDVDRSPELAERFQAFTLPGLRILRLDQTELAAKAGYMPLVELREWLDEHLAQADPMIARVLYETAAPSDRDLARLVEFLGHRTPSIRQTAGRRLSSDPHASVGAVIDALRSGSLAQQLSALEILRQWQAPVGGLDPWHPETIGQAETERLVAWSRTESFDKDSEPADVGREDLSGTASSVDSEHVSRLLSELLTADEEQLPAAMAAAVGLGSAVIPDIRLRLESLSDLPDHQKMVLRELLYRVQVGPRTLLQQEARLRALASLEPETHRRAAQSLLDVATSQDQPLIDELSTDPDPLIREASVSKLQQIGSLRDPDRLNRLLEDPNPSVRTAVLKELAENPKAKSMETLVDYIEQESDEDLLVYAAKTLSQIKSSAEARRALQGLAQAESWRVRAAALEALQAQLASAESAQYSMFSWGSSNTANPVSPELAQTILKATEDPDPFVVERAVKLLPWIVSKSSAEAVAEHFIEHPEQLDAMIAEVSDYERERRFEPLVEQAEAWLNEGSAVRLREATAIIAKLQPVRLRYRLEELLANPDPGIFVSGIRGTLASVAVLRDEQLERQPALGGRVDDNAATEIEPWLPVPGAFERLGGEHAKQDSDRERDEAAASVATALPEVDLEERDVSDDSSAEPNRAASESSELDLFDDFFGDSSAVAGDSEPSDSVGRGGDAPEGSDEDGQVAEAVQDDAGENEPGKDVGNELAQDDFDVAASLFGEAPAVSQAESESASRSAADEESPDTSVESSQFLGPPKIASEWYAQWMETAADRPLWIRQCRAALQSRDASATESAWWRLGMLAVGELSQADELDVDLPIYEDGIAEGPSLALALPWLPEPHRLARLSSIEFDWEAFQQERQRGLLQAATEIDSLEMADWLFDGLADLDLQDADRRRSATELLLRSLLGGQFESSSAWLSSDELQTPVRGFSQFGRDRLPPGWKRAARWLSERYSDDLDTDTRAWLLATLSHCDHALATRSAVGIVTGASEYDSEVETALTIALCDRRDLSSHRASLWLDHQLPEVRRAAIRRLCVPDQEFAQDSQEFYVPVVMDYQDQTPGLWHIPGTLPLEPLHQIDTGSDGELDWWVRLLKLAAGSREAAPEELLADDPPLEQAGLMVVAALCKADRTDTEAMEFYRNQRAVVEEADAMYEMLRVLSGEEVRELRTEMRQQLGSSLFSPF